MGTVAQGGLEIEHCPEERIRANILTNNIQGR